MVRSVADVRTLTCALYHIFYDAINAIKPQPLTITCESGISVDWGGLYLVCGMTMGFLGFRVNDIVAGTDKPLATLPTGLGTSHMSFVAINNYGVNGVIGQIWYNNFTGELILTPYQSVSAARVCFVFLGKTD